MAPSQHAITVASENGIDISGHRAQLISEDMVHSSALILVMEHIHQLFVESFSPRDENKVLLLTGFNNPGEAKGIEDPIGRDLDAYRQCYDELEKEILRILPDLVEIAG